MCILQVLREILVVKLNHLFFFIFPSTECCTKEIGQILGRAAFSAVLKIIHSHVVAIFQEHYVGIFDIAMDQTLHGISFQTAINRPCSSLEASFHALPTQRLMLIRSGIQMPVASSRLKLRFLN